jgi:hypothetical protein
MYCNVHSINKLDKQNLIKYALTKPKWLQLWNCFHYKLFVIITYGPMFIIHELGWTSINW